MLLRHTPTEIKERKALTVNPAKTCQPIGAMYAAFGIHGCLPHSHGSQGCCAYHRSTLSRHYKEPIMAGSSSFTEGASVFGGQANLLQAITNIFSIYDPDIIAVHSTCLSETIGDDLTQIVKKAVDDGKVPEGKRVIYTSTPSYVGSHVTGYANMLTSIVKQLTNSIAKKRDCINLPCGWVEPADMREIKRMAKAMAAPVMLFPDTSDVLDAPMTGKHEFYPKGGATQADLARVGDNKCTIGLGGFATTDACVTLNNMYDLSFEILELPIGLRATDRFITELAKAAAVNVPIEISDERGRLLDAIIDMQQYLEGKRVALWGDPDHLIPLVEFLVDMEMKPVYIVSGTPGKTFKSRIEEILGDKVPDAKIANGLGADMFLMHQWIKNEPVDLLMGNTYGKYISRDEDIPFVRIGFPILDRIGHSYFPLVGYMGGIRLVERILNVFLDKKDIESPEESFELVM